ncbi:MAG: hypothetical protein LUH00_00990, partial [Lachnospiraceae bacterium]|nr:hypothetical protein [Lachnospiraceae bacterium]
EAAEQLIDWGMKQGMEQGIEQGIEQGNEQAAKNMYKKGFDPETIADVLNKSLAQVKMWLGLPSD